MADRLHAVRADVIFKLPVGEFDSGIAVVAGVQRPRDGRGQIVDVAPAKNIASRQGTGRGVEHVGRQRRKRVLAENQRLHDADGVETVPHSRVLLLVARGQRDLHNTVLRRELLPSGGLHARQQPGVHCRRAPATHHERHRFDMHTAPEPPYNGHNVGGTDGRVNGRVRDVRVPVQLAASRRQAVQLGAAGVHFVQRQREHVGHGSPAVDDDRRAVSAESPGHHGRRGAVAGLFFHIRNGENISQADDGTGNGPDHVAVRRCRRSGRLFHRCVFTGDPR